MKLQAISFAVLVICVAVKAQQDVDDANEYVDGIIEEFVLDHSHELEPYKTADQTFSLLYKLITGFAKLSDTYVTGITTIQRVGDSTVTETSEGRDISTKLAMGVVTWHSKAFLGIMKLGITTNIEIRISRIEFELKLRKTADEKVQLNHLKITGISGIDPKVTGLGPLSFLLTKFTSVAMNAFKRILNDEIQKHLELVFKGLVQMRNENTF